MATGGLNAAVPAAVEDTAADNNTTEEPWATTAGEKYKARFWEDLRNLFQQGKLTDVKLLADGQTIPCHRVLLAAASKFFYEKRCALLEDNLGAEGIEFDTLKAIVSFVYVEHVELTIEKVEKLLPASVSLMLPELTNTCKDFLLHKAKHDASACIEIHRIAKTNLLTEIADRAWQVMLQGFQELSKLNAFREMSETNLQEYISDEQLNVANENPVFEAVVTWVRHDVENRKGGFENLMENVKLAHCSLEFLGEVVGKEPLMETGKCFQHLSAAMYHRATSAEPSGTARTGSDNMATGGLNTGRPAAAGDTTTDNATSPEEPWYTAAAEKYKARVWDELKNLFQQHEEHEEGDLKDVMLAAEGQSIPCHRVLLAAASEFFHDKFVIHPKSLEHNLLDIEGIDFETLTDIVYFVYNGHVVLTVEKTEKLLPASVSLMLPELSNMCKDFLLHKVDSDESSCVDIHRIANHNSLELSAKKAWNLMTKNFKEVSQGNAFREMSETDLQDYISNEQLNVANENPVFEAVVAWVRHDVENRKSSFEKLMENVKLSHCSTQFLGEVVRKEAMMETGKCFHHLFDALYHHVPMSPQQLGTARSGYMCNTLIAVYDDSVYTLKAGESEWVKKTSYQKKINRSGACLTGDGIWITGGIIGGNPENSSQCLQLTVPSMKWTALPDMNGPRRDHASVCVGNQVYVMGGYNGETLQSVAYLDEQNRSWNVTCDMPSGLYCHTAVTYKHFVYVFGGWNSQATFMLDTVIKKWSRKADMPTGCNYGSSVVYRDRIYVLGSSDNCCMSYDADQDQWKTHSKPAVKHKRTSAVLWKDRILLCGGLDTSVIEEYNPDTDTWSQWKHQLPKSADIPPVVFAVNM